MVHPFLNGTLHPYLLSPVNIVGRCFIVWRHAHQLVDFILSIFLFSIKIVHLHPCEKLRVINDVFLKRIACFIHKVHVHICIIRIDFSSTLINWHEYWLNTRSCLSHQTGRSRRSNCQTGNVATTIFQHLFVQCRINTLHSVDEWIVLFSFRIIDFESTTLLCHLNRGTVGLNSYVLMNICREISCFRRTVCQSHGSNHVTLCGNAHTCAASFATLIVDLFPEMTFRTFHLLTLWI